MSLKAGSSADFGNSMAEAIQKAWDSVRGDTPTSEQMKLLFIAIANGVIEHLKNNPDSFVFSIESPDGTSINFNIKVTAIK